MAIAMMEENRGRKKKRKKPRSSARGKKKLQQKKSEDRKRKEAERKKKAEERELEKKRKAELREAKRITRAELKKVCEAEKENHPCNWKKQADDSHDGLQGGEISSNEYGACFGLYDDDLVDGELHKEWIKCTKRLWEMMHSECLVTANNQLYVYHVCILFNFSSVSHMYLYSSCTPVQINHQTVIVFGVTKGITRIIRVKG